MSTTAEAAPVRYETDGPTAWITRKASASIHGRLGGRGYPATEPADGGRGEMANDVVILGGHGASMAIERLG